MNKPTTSCPQLCRWRSQHEPPFPLCLARLFVAGAILLPLTPLAGAVITVTNTLDSGPGSFRQALADAEENDVINFSSKVRGTIALVSGNLLISKALTIQGPGANLLSIDAGRSSQVLRIDAHGQAVFVSGLTLTGGQTDSSGIGGTNEAGGIQNDSNLTLSASTVSACISFGSFGGFDAGGGGITNTSGSSMQLIACTLKDNLAIGGQGFHGGSGGSAYGGALRNELGAMASLQNCTISGNQAIGGLGSCTLFCGDNGLGRGAGIYNVGDLVLSACTIASNSASSGGGIWNGGTSTVVDNIVANNAGTDSPDVAGSFVSGGFNLIGKRDGSSGFTGVDDQAGTIAVPLDPILGPLQDNGGPTWTMALLPGSPAIDTGINPDLSFDQRGAARTVDDPNIPNASEGDGTDIGSFELGGRVSWFGNISTRLLIGTGDNVLIGGFIITGTQAKTMVVRGLGPSSHLPTALADPVIDVYSGTSGELVASNDNWNDAKTRQQIMDSGLVPSDELESALWGIFNPGAYTVVTRGKDDTTGIGLVEVYDLDQPVDSKLANISTRGLVQTDDNVLIGGLIALGPDQIRVLVRAIGPSLQISGRLEDPELELRDANGVLIRANDNWRSDQEAEIIATTIPPTADLESAVVAMLPSGAAAYTAIVRGVGGMTGIAVVEVYDLN